MSFELFVNPAVDRARSYSDAHRAILNETDAAAAFAEIRTWPGYAPTALVSLPGFAQACGVGEVLYKDEGTRFGLGSFKALGGAYAVLHQLADHVERATGTRPDAAALTRGDHRALTAGVTVCCATDGNHGRSVAWGAHTFGCACLIYLHATVSAGREQAIAQQGARIERTTGNYDESVHQASADAAANDWIVISDTSWEGYTQIPGDVMHGYTVMAEEMMAAIKGGDGAAKPITHVFVPGGVGGVAAAILAPLWWSLGTHRPTLVVVEPERAACLFASARAGKLTTLSGDIETVMAGLCCGEPSASAWTLLGPGADAFMTIPDDAALAMMCVLADAIEPDPALVCGESSAASPAALAAIMADASAASALDLDGQSRVLLLGTEGDTDPELYKEIVGRSADAVRAA
ncbi:MAG: diaminopropionate ammonia-lyase [Gammaproteobacteria bacterium]